MKSPITIASVFACLTISFFTIAYAINDEKRNAHEETATLGPMVAEIAELQQRVNDGSARERAMETAIARLEERIHEMETRPVDEKVEDGETEDIHAEETEIVHGAEPIGPIDAPEEYGDLLRDRFENEGYDQSWAPRVEQTLQPELIRLGEEVGFQFDTIECRTTGCLAVVEFENYKSVRSKGAQLASHHYSVNCAMGLALPEPEDKNGPYRANLFFQDCVDSADTDTEQS